MKNHLQLNPIIADFKKGRHYFGDIQYKALYFTIWPYFPTCLLFYRRVAEVSYNSCTFP